jgi:hypothetical protein
MGLAVYHNNSKAFSITRPENFESESCRRIQVLFARHRSAASRPHLSFHRTAVSAFVDFCHSGVLQHLECVNNDMKTLSQTRVMPNLNYGTQQSTTVTSIWFENWGVPGSRPSPLLRKRPETAPSTTPTSKFGGHDPNPTRLTPMIYDLTGYTIYCVHALIDKIKCCTMTEISAEHMQL